MKALSIALAIAALTGAGAALPHQADAAGCVKGAIVGGVAGHFAHRHTMLGAGAGCVIGHHMANKHAREQRENDKH